MYWTQYKVVSKTQCNVNKIKFNKTSQKLLNQFKLNYCSKDNINKIILFFLRYFKYHHFSTIFRLLISEIQEEVVIYVLNLLTFSSNPKLLIIKLPMYPKISALWFSRYFLPICHILPLNQQERGKCD